MRLSLILAAATLTLVPATVTARKAPAESGVGSVISALESVGCYQAQARFTVTMPQLNDDVIYALNLQQQAAPADTLLPCTYLIEWTMTSREDPIKGFSAYYDGNHFRYSGERLQEYHMKWNPIPFSGSRANSRTASGVQRTAQFANLLPVTIAEELRRMERNPAYTLTVHPDTVISGTRCIAIEAVMKLRGATAMESTYVFDRSTRMPLAIDFENNPGSVSEQTVSVTFTDTRLPERCEPIDEQFLMTRYANVFENFRESNFRIENLVGTKLPGFALLTTTGERYMRRTPDAFVNPTIVALLDASHGFTPRIVEDLRAAVDQLPCNADVIFAFTDKRIDDIEAIVPQIRPGETLLMGSRPLARDCGAASLPAIIITDASATVKNVILGYNNDLASDVIQKMALLCGQTPQETATQNVTDDSNQNNDTSIATSMETVHFKETLCHTYGYLPAVGSQAPEFNLTAVDLSPVKLSDYAGKTVVLNIFPSLDTDVCARSVRRFNEEAAKLPDVKVICVSEDLPFAMARFCTANGIENVVTASAFRSPQFGEKYGVMLVDGPLKGLLTRAVIIIGPDGVVKYRDLVNEITTEPDYEAAIKVLEGKY